jgi:long-subunit fatty acid transport protein
MGRRGWSRLAGISASVSLVTWAGAAAASSGIDSPESGVVQVGRGSAWVARADDPLAVYFNPAAMAFQANSVHVGTQLMIQNRCFTRLGLDGKPVPPGPGIPAPLLPGQAQPTDGSTLPSDKVCSAGGVFPNPQVAGVWRVANRVALGLAVVAPHASGSNSWPESLSYTNSFGVKTTEPAPQRYMLVSSNALIIYPTISVAYAPLDNLSFGAGFVWGIGTLDFTTFSESVSTPPPPGTLATDHAVNDVRAELKGKDLFIPGVILSALWMPTSNLDVAAWFHWQDALRAETNLTLDSLYWTQSGALNAMPCTGLKANCNVTQKSDAGTVTFQIPMEAKLGLRFHLPRKDQSKKPGWASNPDRKVRDPMSEDLFDVEVDFTWANNSAVQNLDLSFVPGIRINDGSPTGVGQVPANGDIPHHWKDVVGVRAGGDFVAVPNLLSLRTGAFYETKGVDDQYLSLDFDLAQKIGVSGGATLRLGPIDISVAYQHTFYGTLDNGGKGLIYGLSGDASGTASPGGGKPPVCGTDPKNPNVGPGCFRSWQPVNGGILQESLNEVGFAATARF